MTINNYEDLILMFVKENALLCCVVMLKAVSNNRKQIIRLVQRLCKIGYMYVKAPMCGHVGEKIGDIVCV